MTQEEKELLIKDLCARLPYSGVQIHVSYEDNFKYDKTLTYEDVKNYSQLPACSTTIVKPYLRSLSSMTKSERKEFDDLSKFDEDVWMGNHKVGFPKQVRIMSKCVDWLNKKMFDYCGLILKGLAIEAPEGMY